MALYSNAGLPKESSSSSSGSAAMMEAKLLAFENDIELKGQSEMNIPKTKSLGKEIEKPESHREGLQDFSEFQKTSQKEYLETLAKIKEFVTEKSTIPGKENADACKKAQETIDQLLKNQAKLNYRVNKMSQDFYKVLDMYEALKNTTSIKEESKTSLNLMEQLSARNRQITDMTCELNQLRMNTQNDPSPSLAATNQMIVLRKELDKKSSHLRETEHKLSQQYQTNMHLNRLNQNLSAQIFELKESLETIDMGKFKRDLESNIHRINFLEEENSKLTKEIKDLQASPMKPYPSTDKKSDLDYKLLEKENLRLQETIDTLKKQQFSEIKEPEKVTDPSGRLDFSSPSMKGPLTDRGTNFLEETTHGRLEGLQLSSDDLANKQIFGEVSVEEMKILEDRIKEFGDCNLELEDIIYKLKNRIVGEFNYDSAGNYDSGAYYQRSFKNREAKEFQRLLGDLRNQVEKITHNQSSGGAQGYQAANPDLLIQLETLKLQNQRGNDAELRAHILMQDFKKSQEALEDLRLKYKELQVKSSTLEEINVQNEKYIGNLLSMISENKDYFKRLITENQSLKLSHEEAVQEIEVYRKRNCDLVTMTDRDTGGNKNNLGRDS